MRNSWIALTFASISAAAVTATSLTTSPSHDTHDCYALHLHPTASPDDVAHSLSLDLQGPLGHLEHHYLLCSPKHDHDVLHDAVSAHRRWHRRNDLLDSVLFHQKQKLRAPHQKRTPLPPPLQHRQLPANSPAVNAQATSPAVLKGNQIAQDLGIADPIYNEQWHLYNPVEIGHDLNVTGVWTQGITGKNATVCIVDDGLDMDSRDLAPNFFAAGSYDFNDKVDLPKPQLADDRHGTRCAGEVAAAKNDVCGVGVAWDARIAGIRILSKAITDADEAVAMTYGFQENDIYSCSWGPPDDGREMGEPGMLIKRAMVTAIQKGRQGKGTIYVFAAGNGAGSDDNCNFDGYTNSIYSVTVGAIDRKGEHPYYSEKCSAQLVVTYSSGSGDAIHTTDVGVDACYGRHGGTSAAGPLAAGIFALVLQVRPDLTWRDIQWLSVLTAVKLDNPSDWQNTTIGKQFSHQFGYGKLDAWATVEAAKDFKPVKPQSWYNSPWQHIRHEIPQGEVGLASTFTVTKDALKSNNLETVEHVTVTMNVNHTRRGDLSVELQSPSGIVSHLSTSRKYDDAVTGYNDWTFMSVAHWGESGIGEWKVIVKDTVVDDNSGTFIDWRLNLFGECIDPSKQELLPMPTKHDDDEHDREDGAVSTHPISIPTQTAPPLGNPTDHIDRPVNEKPSEDEHEAEPVPVTTTAAFEPAVSAPPGEPEGPIVSAPEGKEGEDKEVESGKEEADESFLPSPFPTFGVTKKTQVWVYSVVVLIILFLCCLGTWAYLARRKQNRNAREAYEFEVLDEEEDDESRGLRGGAGGKRGKRRAGELYDAFAGESDEEIFSEDEKYRDDAPEEKQRRLSSSEGSSNPDRR